MCGGNLGGKLTEHPDANVFRSNFGSTSGCQPWFAARDGVDRGSGSLAHALHDAFHVEEVHVAGSACPVFSGG